MHSKGITELGELKNSVLNVVFCEFDVLFLPSFCFETVLSRLKGIPLHLWFVFCHDCVCVCVWSGLPTLWVLRKENAQ